MSESEIESLPIINPWGVPDWRDASAYPGETLPLVYWRWEFLRRREDYREDWLQWAMETYEKRKADYEANPVDQWVVGYSKTTREPIVEEFEKKILPIDDLEFYAEMPESEERYGLQYLPNPTNPRPKCLAFIPSSAIDWDVGRGEGPSNYWGIEYTLYTHEVVIRVDLTAKPAQELMAELLKPTKLSPEGKKFLNLDEKVKGNILNMLRFLDDSPSPPKDKKNGVPVPRIIKDPQYEGVVHVIWDTRLPYGHQHKASTAILTHLQELLPEKPQARRARPSAWANYLRVLDARATNPETDKPYATYEDIGKTVFKCLAYGDAKAQAHTAHKDARRLMVDFPS